MELTLKLTQEEISHIVTALRDRCNYGEISEETKQQYLSIRKILVRQSKEQGVEIKSTH